MARERAGCTPQRIGGCDSNHRESAPDTTGAARVIHEYPLTLSPCFFVQELPRCSSRAGEKVLASGLCMRGEYVAEWVHVFLRGKPLDGRSEPLDGSISIGENEPVADDGSFEVSLQIPASVPSGEYTVGWMCGIDDVVLIHVFEGGPALTVPPGAGGPATSNSPGAGPTSTASSPSSTPHAASPGATPAANGEASNASTVSTAPTLATTGSRPANLGALSVIGIVNVAAAACLGQRRRRSSS